MNKQIEILNEDIESLEKRLALAKKERDELLLRDHRTDLFQKTDTHKFALADRCHRITCHYNHTDACSRDILNKIEKDPANEEE